MNCPMCDVPMHNEISFFGEQCMNWGCACYRMEAKQRKQITDAITAARADGMREAAKLAEAYPINGSMQVADFIRSAIKDGEK